MIDFLDNIDAEMSDGGARVVPIITEIHEVTDNTDIQDDKADDIPSCRCATWCFSPR